MSNRLALLVLLLPASAVAIPYDWPGAAPCNSTLQACIDGVPNGAFEGRRRCSETLIQAQR